MVQIQTVSGIRGPVKVDTYAFKPAERSIFTGPEDDCPASVLIVIPVVNLWREYTEACLKSIAYDRRRRILVIDNGSIDETHDELAKLTMKRDDLFFVRNEKNWGVARSWNYGIKVGFGQDFDYVLVLNNDVLLHANCVDRLAERLEKKDDVILASALDARGECVVPEDIFQKDDKEKESVAESGHPNFSAFIINKKCLDEVGEFDEGFYPGFFEDNDMHYRIKLAGLKAICYPPALFYHYGSRTQNDPKYVGGLVNAERFEACRGYYVKKWGGSPGNEQFSHPFNDPNKSIKWIKQNQKTEK